MAIAKKVLEELGLSDKEARTYLTLLELGASPVQKIAQKSGINRATTYVCLEELLKLGLVSTVQKGVKTYFTPEHPEQLMALVTRQQKDIERKKEDLQDVISNLKNVFESAGDRPVVKFYEGKGAIEAIQEDFLRDAKSKESYSYVSLDDLFSTHPKYENDYSKRRIQKKINIKTIYNSSKGPVPDANAKENLREAVWLPNKEYPLSGEITIYGDKMFFVSHKGKVLGVVIENKQIADSMRTIFKLAWQSARDVEKKNKK